jgi:hypothetical protein
LRQVPTPLVEKKRFPADRGAGLHEERYHPVRESNPQLLQQAPVGQDHKAKRLPIGSSHAGSYLLE